APARVGRYLQSCLQQLDANIEALNRLFEPLAPVEKIIQLLLITKSAPFVTSHFWPLECSSNRMAKARPGSAGLGSFGLNLISGVGSGQPRALNCHRRRLGLCDGVKQEVTRLRRYHRTSRPVHIALANPARTTLGFVRDQCTALAVAS